MHRRFLSLGIDVWLTFTTSCHCSLADATTLESVVLVDMNIGMQATEDIGTVGLTTPSQNIVDFG